MCFERKRILEEYLSSPWLHWHPQVCSWSWISVTVVSRIMALLRPLLAFLAILLTFLFFATLTEQQIVRDIANGLSYANFGKQEKFRLNAGQLENTTAHSSSQCCAKCLPNKSCFSVNYGGIGRNECQLLSANKFRSSDQMTIDKTFEHFSIVVSTIFVQCSLYPNSIWNLSPVQNWV